MGRCHKPSSPVNISAVIECKLSLCKDDQPYHCLLYTSVICCGLGYSDSFAFWEKDLTYESESVYNYLQAVSYTHLKGYPFGKTAAELNEPERIMACIDIYQALTEDRPYKMCIRDSIWTMFIKLV